MKRLAIIAMLLLTGCAETARERAIKQCQEKSGVQGNPVREAECARAGK